jgi:SAM-dependent methyltransferase
MAEKNESIYAFDYSMICNYFSLLNRQGPGSPAATLRALEFIEGPDGQPLTVSGVPVQLADIGCGTGGQTMILAEHTTARITGLDLSPQFIDLFNRNAESLGFQNRVHGVNGTMEKLPFERDSIDVIWGEGSIAHIGFERGICEWKTVLKTGGYIAVTDATWFTDERPDEIETFWNDSYPEIGTTAEKIAQLQTAGYKPVAAFALPENCWTDNYFVPAVDARRQFLERRAGDKAAEAFIRFQEHEAELYEKYKQYYGYVFYIGKKL